LLKHFMAWAFSFALANAGSNSEAKMAIMAITTSNSIKVKAPRLEFALASFSLDKTSEVMSGAEWG